MQCLYIALYKMLNSKRMPDCVAESVCFQYHIIWYSFLLSTLKNTMNSSLIIILIFRLNYFVNVKISIFYCFDKCFMYLDSYNLLQRCRNCVVAHRSDKKMKGCLIFVLEGIIILVINYKKDIFFIHTVKHQLSSYSDSQISGSLYVCICS